VRKLLKWISRTIVKIFFREIIIEGADSLPDSRPTIFTPNHPNELLDPLLMQYCIKESTVTFVAKAPLFKIPIFGSILRAMGAIPVIRRMDVNNVNVDYTEFFNACLDTLINGDSIAIFPEGRSLPQPFLAPLRTGPARLFFLAKDNSIPVQIVPVGLNYERGSIFRSSVLISIAPPLDTTTHEKEYLSEPSSAVRNLTDAIGETLDQRVFQAETYRDRELILLLERLYTTEETYASSWADRLDRLRAFESAIDQLRHTHSKQLDKIRHLLARYQRISEMFQVDVIQQAKWKRSTKTFSINIIGLFFASIGWVLNILPYKFIDLLITVTRKNESGAATAKIIWGLILFPLTYIIETIIIYKIFGGLAAIFFAIVIVPLTLFTLKFYEWREEHGISLPDDLQASSRVAVNLQKLKERIVHEVDLLANELETLKQE
jgi:1-acyl-sn-glycerol-3-phosphate acyltransferase